MTKKKPPPKPPATGSGLGKSVEKHPLFHEIYEMLCKRWSSHTVIRVLEDRYQAQFVSGEYRPLPDASTIRRYRQYHLPPGEVLPPSLIEEKLDNLDVQVDLFKSLHLAYRVAEDRIARHAATEEDLALPMSGLDRAYETLLKTGQLLWQVGQDLGLYPRGSVVDVRNVAMGPGARSTSNLFVFNGEKKSVHVMTDEEMDMAEAILKRDLEG